MTCGDVDFLSLSEGRKNLNVLMFNTLRKAGEKVNDKEGAK